MAIGNKHRASANLVHANATARAQLIQAHKSATASGGTAPLISAPAPQGRRRNYGGGRSVLTPPVTVGQGSRSGYAKTAAQGATVGGVDLTLHQMKDGSFELRDANGNVRRRYDKDQMAHVNRRGNAGATLDELDTAAFFRNTGGKTAREIELEDEQRKAEIAAKAKRGEMDYAHKQALEKQLLADKLATERAEKSAKITAQGRVDAAKATAEAKAELDRRIAEEENAAFNKKWGVEDGITLSQKDKDDIAAGRSRWGYSQKDQSEIDEINAEFDRQSQNFDKNNRVFYDTGNGTYRMRKPGDTDYNGQELLTEYEMERNATDKQIAEYRKGVQPNTEAKTAEQIFNGAYKGPDGTLYVEDGKGGIVPIKGTEPQKPQETPEQKREADRLKAEDKLQDEKKKYILSQIGDARKAWQKSVDDYDPDDPGSIKPGDFDQAGALKAAESNWNAVYGSPMPTPNPQESTSAPDPNNPLADFEQFKRK